MRNIIVTGASRGLGLITTRLLLENNYCVYSVSREVTDELCILKQNFNKNLIIVKLDLLNQDKIKALFYSTIFNNDLKIHGLVNNAAIAYDDIVTNFNLSDFEEMLKVNLIAPMLLTKYVIRRMLLHNIKGSLVHVSSICTHSGYKGLSMYAATKGAMESFSRNVAREWGAKGIRSNCVVPGFMDTDMSSSLSKDQKKRIYSRNALQTSTSLASVAEMVLFLLSDKSVSITGKNYIVDSGTL